MKLQQKITCFIMGGMFIGFTAFLGINHSMMQKTTIIEINDKLTGKVSNLTRSIEDWLEVKQRISYTLSQQAQKLEDRSPENVRKYLLFTDKAANVNYSMVYYQGKNLIHSVPSINYPPDVEEKNMPYQTV